MTEPGFDDRERERIVELNRALAVAYGRDGNPEFRAGALRLYLETMAAVGRRHPMFAIANHRLYSDGDRLIVPYEARGRLSVFEIRDGESTLLAEHSVPHGTLLTDALLAETAGVQGVAIDLESEIYRLDVDRMPSIQVSRLRDLAGVLQKLNTCGSRHEAVYLLRFLVARFCSTNYRGIAGAKNLMPEVNRVRGELAEFMNGPFAGRLRLPTRVVVRNVSGLLSRPKLIDEVWQDTIVLAEVRVRGSAIANEIRRSTHHALGKRTLELARSYLQWLRTGEEDFPESQRQTLSPADEAARDDPMAHELVARIVDDLEQVLGSSQVAARLSEWRQSYAAELMCCESGHALEEELESLIENGIREDNRWVYLHRLRAMSGKASAGSWAAGAKEDFERRIGDLGKILPGHAAFQPDTAEALARTAVSDFSGQLRRDHQDALFAALDGLVACYARGEPFAAFELCCELRQERMNLAGDGVFRSQRYLLQQLDCILEELGFFALRHLASDYLDHGVSLDQCLQVVFRCSDNLILDGLFSRELWDLSAMLVNPARSPSELLDVLEQIQRNYHRLVHRVSEAYEVMAEHLGYSRTEMRAVLANFQRTMHDLNSLVHFSDLARTAITERRDRLREPGGGAAGENPWDFVHLSHAKDVARRVEDRTAASLQARYGGKGSGLLYIAYLGVPTRDAFIVPTVLARMNLHEAEKQHLKGELLRHVRILEMDILRNERQSLRFGDPAAPLLLAVRGGSVFSMPGQLATVVFAGMTDAVAESLAQEDEWFAWDAYRRFLASYAAAVWHLDLEGLDLVEKAKRRHGVALKTDLPGSAMREVVAASKAAIRDAGHGAELEEVLQDVDAQLRRAVRAVHDSWHSERARRYRAIKHLSDGWNTAVIVQQMAAGNRTNIEEMKPGMDETKISLTGVIPHTCINTLGIRTFTGDVKFSACGDDLVGGLTAAKSFEPVQELRAQAPMLERRLNHVSARLRRFLGSDVEIEFTVERGILSVLQTRSAQMELRYSPRTFADPGPPAGRGIGINGGAFRGVVAFDDNDVRRLSGEEWPAESDGILLVLENPIPDEIPLILSVDGLLAARGGSTSHAAVAVHGIDDKPYAAVLGVAELHVYRNEAVLTDAEGRPAHTIRRGDVLSIHGQTGEVYVGSRPVLSAGGSDGTEQPGQEESETAA